MVILTRVRPALANLRRKAAQHPKAKSAQAGMNAICDFCNTSHWRNVMGGMDNEIENSLNYVQLLHKLKKIIQQKLELGETYFNWNPIIEEEIMGFEETVSNLKLFKEFCMSRMGALKKNVRKIEK